MTSKYVIKSVNIQKSNKSRLKSALHNSAQETGASECQIFIFFDEIACSKYTDWPVDLRSVSVNYGSATHLVQVVQTKY